MDFSQLKQLALSVALLTLVGCASAPKSIESVKTPSVELASVIGSAAPGAQVELPANNSLGLTQVVVGRTYFAASGRECRRLQRVDGSPIQRVACKSEAGVWSFARDLRPVSSSKAFDNSGANAPQINTTQLDASTVQPLTGQPLVPSAGSALLLNEDGSVVSSRAQSDIGEPVIIDSVDDGLNVQVDTPTSNLAGESVVLPNSVAGDTVQRELYANETLWSFAKRTTGNALNWRTIADLNGITDAKTLASGAQLSIPAELVSQGG